MWSEDFAHLPDHDDDLNGYDDADELDPDDDAKEEGDITPTGVTPPKRKDSMTKSRILTPAVGIDNTTGKSRHVLQLSTAVSLRFSCCASLPFLIISNYYCCNLPLSFSSPSLSLVLALTLSTCARFYLSSLSFCFPTT